MSDFTPVDPVELTARLIRCAPGFGEFPLKVRSEAGEPRCVRSSKGPEFVGDVVEEGSIVADDQNRAWVFVESFF